MFGRAISEAVTQAICTLARIEGMTKRPRFNMHFTPTSACWRSMVERFFRDITTERLRRGVFTSVAELITAIDQYIAHHSAGLEPRGTQARRSPSGEPGELPALVRLTDC